MAAIVTSGITASWGGTALGDITEIKWLVGGGLPQGRGGTAGTAYWSMDAGSIEITAFGTALNRSSEWGRKAVLAVGGTARVATATATIITVALSCKAICQTLDIGAKVNDVWRHKGTFKIVLE
jgi:hypothetical protein